MAEYIFSENPSASESGDNSGVTLGVIFRVDVNGTISGARVYRGAANTMAGCSIGLWEMTTNTAGTLLASRTGLTVAAGPGWTDLTFTTPISVTAGKHYLIAYWKPENGNTPYYYFTSNRFSSGVDNASGNLYGVGNADNILGGQIYNGRYEYSNVAMQFPTQNFGAAWYGVDVIFNAAGGGSTTNQTVNVGAATSVGVSKRANKALPITASRTVSVLKQARKRANVASTSTTALRRAAGKSVAIASSGAVSARKAISRSLAVASTGAVSVRKAATRTLSLSSSSTTLMNASRAYLKTVAIAAASSVGLSKQPGKRIAISSAGSVSVRKAISRTLSVLGSGAVSVRKAMAKSLALSRGTTVGLSTVVDAQVTTPPTFVSAGNFATTISATSTIVPVATGTATGDVEFMQAVCINSTTAFTITKSGTLDWNLLYDVEWAGSRYAMWWKRKESGETAPTIANAGRTGSNLLAGAMTVYTGGKSDDIPIGGYDISYGTAAQIAGPSIETVGRNSTALTFTTRIGNNAATAPDLLWDENRDNGTSGGGAARYYVDSQPIEFPSVVPGVDRGATGNFVSFAFELLGTSDEIDLIEQPHEGAMWVWDFADIIGNSTKEDLLINTCVNSDVADIYCYTYGSFLTTNLAAVQSFIADCSLNNIRVWGLDGDRSYFADADGSSDLLDSIQSVIDYNDVSAPNQSFYGFHIDCEPADAGGYTAFHNGIASSALSTTPGSGSWQSTQALDRENLMRNWVSIHEDSFALCSANDLKLGSALPTWFDDYFGEPIACTYNSITQNVYLHIRNYCNHISLMSYSTNPKNVIDRCLYEIVNCGDATIGISVETHAGPGTGVSYADTAGKNTPAAVFADIDTAHQRFSQYPGYTSFHIHDWEGWSALNGFASVVNLTLNIAATTTTSFRKAVSRLLSVTAASAVSARKGSSRSISVPATSSVVARKGAGKLSNISSSSSVAASRGVAKLVAVLANGGVNVRRAGTRTLSISSATSTGVNKGVGKRTNIAIATTTTGTAIRAFLKVVSIAVAGSVGLGKAVSKRIQINPVAAVAVGFGQFLAVIVDLTVGTATSIRKASGKTVSIAVPATVAARKAVARTLVVPASASLSFAKGLAKTFSMNVSSATTFVSGQAYTRVVNVASATSVSVRKQAGKVSSITRTTSVSMARAVAKTVNISPAAIVSVRKAITRTLSVGADVAVSAQKSVSKAFSNSVSSAVTAVASRVFLKSLNVTVSTGVSIGKGVGKGVEVAADATIATEKALTKTVSVAATALVRTAKQIGKAFSNWVSIQQTADASSPFLPQPTPAERTVIVDFEDRTVIAEGVANPETVE